MIANQTEKVGMKFGQQGDGKRPIAGIALRVVGLTGMTHEKKWPTNRILKTAGTLC
jgi:hypothetical protein